MVDQQCFNHSQRTAVARCPECKRFYCRECVTEFEDRVVCAACLLQLSRLGSPGAKRGFKTATNVLKGFAGIMLLWIYFFLIAQVLLRIPTKFHDGTIWHKQTK